MRIHTKLETLLVAFLTKKGRKEKKNYTHSISEFLVENRDGKDNQEQNEEVRTACCHGLGFHHNNGFVSCERLDRSKMKLYLFKYLDASGKPLICSIAKYIIAPHHHRSGKPLMAFTCIQLYKSLVYAYVKAVCFKNNIANI